ncbi:hypothetical protein CFOL_v3_06026, partial [Cephalotus follicularis]
ILAKEYNVTAHPKQLYREKTKAMENEWAFAEAYSKLYKYADIVKDTNPGSTVKIFICYGTSKRGFAQGCRPFLGLDGCHLKSPFGGVLLCATVMDGKQGLFPVAFAIVEME